MLDFYFTRYNLLNICGSYYIEIINLQILEHARIESHLKNPRMKVLFKAVNQDKSQIEREKSKVKKKDN